MAFDQLPDENRQLLIDHFRASRTTSMSLANLFSRDDWMLQSMEAASPIKWNLAHTSWFYETFVLKPYQQAYAPYDEQFNYLFNSYYNQIGDKHPRPMRGLLSRPDGDEVVAYREHVTGAVIRLMQDVSTQAWATIAPLIALGCAHEEQHQELLLTDITHALAQNPLQPAILVSDVGFGGQQGKPVPLNWAAFEPGLATVGAEASAFHFDNEGPQHRVYLEPFELANRPVTNRDYLAFIDDGGYETSSLWLSDGWDAVHQLGWQAPLYWQNRDGNWTDYSLYGRLPLVLDAPVRHISFFEAAAYAAWTGYRLPREAEWEIAAMSVAVDGALDGEFLSGADFKLPSGVETGQGLENAATGLTAMFGGVWEWTDSPYVAYPGYRAPEGAIGEYNGKFMSSQMVLRGGSCTTPEGHVRPTYRNFFPPDARWQFAGLRLARDL